MRLEGQKKAGYYPTPLSLMPFITQWLDVETPDATSPIRYRILDPCAGEGSALHMLWHTWPKGIGIPFGIELDEERGMKLAARIFGYGQAATNDAFQMLVEPDSMSILYLNPPYDWAFEDGTAKRKTRLEYLFLKQYTDTLVNNGILVYVVPVTILKSMATIKWLSTHFADLNILRFDDANDHFDQIVIFGRKKWEADPDALLLKKLTELRDVEWKNFPVITKVTPPGNVPFYKVPGSVIEPGSFTTFRPVQLTPEEVAAVTAPIQGRHIDAAFKVLGQESVQTATPPRAGHVAMLIPAGITNGAILEIPEIIEIEETPEEETAADANSEGDALTTELIKDLAAMAGFDAGGIAVAIEQLMDGEPVAEVINLEPAKRVKAMIKGRLVRAQKRSLAIEDKSTDEVGKTVTRVTRTDTIDSQVVLLDQEGNVRRIKPKDMPGFLGEHLPALSDVLIERTNPYYQFKSMNGFEKAIRGLNLKRRIPNTNKRGLMVAQQHATAAAATVLQNEPTCFIVGEMGTGKTLLGTGVAAALQSHGQFSRGMVLCPPHLVSKWIQEIEITWPACKAVFINSPSDVENFYREPGPILGVIKSTTSSLGPTWRHSFDYMGPAATDRTSSKEPTIWLKKPKAWIGSTTTTEVIGHPTMEPSPSRIPHLKRKEESLKRQRDGRSYLIPKKGKKIINLKARAKEKVTTEEQAGSYLHYMYKRGLRCPTCGTKQENGPSHLNNRQTFCQNEECRQPLWEFTETLRRWPLGKVIKRAAKRHGKLDLFIADEVHQYKGGDSERGYAFGHLCDSAEKTLALTGTLFGGKATTIFWLLYRMIPEFRREYTDDSKTGQQRIELTRFVREYGLMEYVDTAVERDGKTGGNAKWTTVAKEIPGLVPSLIRWILPYAVFINLNDLGYALPEYRENHIPVTMTPGMQEEYDRVTNALYEALSQALAMNDKGLLGVYLSILMTWPEIPSRVRTAYTRGGDLIVATEPVPEDWITPKEKQVIDHIKRSVAANRGVMLFMQMTLKTDITGRWVKLLKQEGITVSVCNADTSKRIEWFEEQREKGTQVIITHPRKVELGMDLLAWPEVIWLHEKDYSSYTVLQASRRAWRIGQVYPVNVTFYYYENSMQDQALLAVMKKILAHVRLNGGLVDDDTIVDDNQEGMESALAKLLITQVDMQRRLSHAKLFLQAIEEGNREGAVTAASFPEVTELTDTEAILELSRIIEQLETALANMKPARTLDALFAQRTEQTNAIRGQHQAGYLGGDTDGKYEEAELMDDEDYVESDESDEDTVTLFTKPAAPIVTEITEQPNYLVIYEESACYVATGESAGIISDILADTSYGGNSSIHPETGEMWIEIAKDDTAEAILAYLIECGEKLKIIGMVQTTEQPKLAEVTEAAAEPELPTQTVTPEPEVMIDTYPLVAEPYEGAGHGGIMFSVNAESKGKDLLNQTLFGETSPVRYVVTRAKDGLSFYVSPQNAERVLRHLRDSGYKVTDNRPSGVIVAPATVEPPSSNGHAAPKVANANVEKVREETEETENSENSPTQPADPEFPTFNDHWDMLAGRAQTPERIAKAKKAGRPLIKAYTMMGGTSDSLPRADYLPVYEDDQLYIYRLDPKAPTTEGVAYNPIIGVAVSLPNRLHMVQYVTDNRWRVVVAGTD